MTLIMKWYQTIIKRILSGVIFFLLPVILLLFVLGKSFVTVQKLILPLKKYLPEDNILGIGLITLISLLLILLISYIAGILVERAKVKSLITKLEDKVLVFIPGYTMMKSRASESISESDDKWQAVLIADNDDWRIGIQVEGPVDGYCSIFFPEPPDAKSGEMKLVHESKLKKLNIPVSQLIKIIRKYGLGTASLLNSDKKTGTIKE